MVRMVLWELRSQWKSLAIWSAIMLLLILIAVSKFEGYYNNPELSKVFESMPQGFMKAFGINNYTLTSLQGFYTAMFIYFGLMGGMAAAMWGNGAITREERTRTADFLLVLPLPRSRIVLAKAVASLILCVAFPLITWVISLVAVRSFQPDAAFYRFLRQEMLAMFLVELIFWALGVFLGSTVPSPKHSGSLTLVILLALYVLAFLQPLDERLDFLKYLTPFKYFDPAQWTAEGQFQTIYLLLAAVWVLPLIVGAFLSYERRDIALVGA